ncbi:PqiC family protein [Rhodanobacter sp. DHB23]|uniref:PqiC family protein n=1 Tax=Rhodanobacter sp. DHB23 TaxID=2775923 RepID=UPI00177ED86E|nr:PqiC family protein [Rhodanobacter sp. DHB23]MBD8871972.1 membrane integrity-associated transporter subunit PqiC [Rhodanobacter sp. DHB23]
MSLRHWTLAGALALGLAGCASAPMHYYTLTTQGGPAVRIAPAPYPFELAPVGVPAQVDVPQLVVRTGGQGMQPLDGQRWIAPLGDEIRGALSADLAGLLGVADVGGLPGNGQPRLRITLDVRRFESVPGDHALVEAAWSLRLAGTSGGQEAFSCVSMASERVGAGYDALVGGHQRALAALARDIAGAARAYEAGNRPTCPAD